MKKTTIILSAIVLLSLASRILPVLLAPSWLKEVKSDSLEYNELARNVLSGKGYIYENVDMPFKGATAYRTPGYPLFLAFIYKMFGVENYQAVRLYQAVLLSLIPLILYLTARLFLSERIALISAILGLAYKPFIILNFYGGPVFILSENLVILTFLLFVYLFLRGLKLNSYPSIFISGIFIGLSALTRPMFGIFPLAAVIIIAVKEKMNFKKIAVCSFYLFISFSLVVMPWVARNYKVFKKPIFSTQTGNVLYAGNNPAARGGWGRDMPEDIGNRSNAMTEVDSNSFLAKEAVSYLRNNISIIPKLFARKLVVAFQPFYSGYEWNLFYALIFPLFIFSIFYMRRSDPLYLMILIAALYFIFISLVFLGDPRFRYPFEPLFIIGAAYSINAMLESKYKNAITTVIAVYAALNILIYFNWGLIWAIMKKGA